MVVDTKGLAREPDRSYIAMVRILGGVCPRPMRRTSTMKESMNSELFRPAMSAAPSSPNTVHPAPDAFQRLPVNLSKDEIRAIVRDVLG